MMYILLALLLIGFIGAIVAVDYTCAHINEVAQRVQDVERKLGSIDNHASHHTDLETLEREVKELHQMLAGGFAALIALGIQKHSAEDRKKLAGLQGPAYETLLDFTAGDKEDYPSAEWKFFASIAKSVGERAPEGGSEHGQS